VRFARPEKMMSSWHGVVIAVLVTALGFVGLAGSGVAAQGSGTVARLAKANDAYAQGRWAEAAEEYRALADQGVNDPVVWYNLGNAYFKLLDFGRSRASYERALRLAPRDADVRHNLELLQARLGETPADEGLMARMAFYFTTNELAVAASVAWFAAVGLFLASFRPEARRVKPPLLGGAGLAAATLLLGLSLLVLRAYGPDGGTQAVVVPATAKLFNGPGREYTSGVQLSAGNRVKVLRADGDWREVAANQRVTGWLRAEELEQI